MSAVASVAATFIAGVLSSASPCVMAAVPVTVGLVGSSARTSREAVWLSVAFVGGMTLSFLVLGMMAARLGLFLGIVNPLWGALVGVMIAAIGIALFLGAEGFVATMPLKLQQRFRGSGWAGAAVLGALVGTVTSPCATPALAAALAIAGAGALNDGSVWLGASLLLAYGLGHSVLLLVASVAPMQAQHISNRLGGVQRWLPGRRAFAAIMISAGAWLAITSTL
jgi:cytochrome c-type biogenesis protein